MKKDLFVIAHNIRSCYNVGSIFRTADALGVRKIFLGGYTPNPDKNGSISKTALGAEKFVSWEAHWHTHRIIEKLKKEGTRIVALEQTEKSIPLEKFKPKFPLVIILGNEVKGLSKNIIDRADESVEILMKGQKESLNVSVAFGVVAYSILNTKK